MNKSIIFILGTGRSGTSLLTRILSLSGCHLFNSMIPADFANPTGYWEPADVVALNEQILRRYGSSWFDPTLAMQNRLNSDDQLREECIASISEFLARTVKDTPIVCKDPRMSETLWLWTSAAKRLELTSCAIIATRTPNEFIKSTQANLAHFHSIAPQEFLSLLWLKRTLLAERHSRGLGRVVVDYNRLVTDWKLERARISSALDIPLNASNDTFIETCVDVSLHRQRDGEDPTDPFPNSWLLRTFKTLSAASIGDSTDQKLLDDIFAEFESCERAFRSATIYFNSLISLSRSQASLDPKAIPSMAPQDSL